jgi:hypothetical protein
MTQNLLGQAVDAYFKAGPWPVGTKVAAVSAELNTKLRRAAEEAVPGIAGTTEWLLLAPFHLPLIDKNLTDDAWKAEVIY